MPPRVLQISLLSLVLLTACGAPAQTDGGAAAMSAPATSGASNTISWSVWGSAEELAGHQAVAGQFMAAHPEIAVQIRHTPCDAYHDKLKTIIAAGDSANIPDVIFLANDFSRYAEAGQLENLTPWVEKTGYDLADYWPTLVERATIDGKLYGLQRDLDLRLLYYNKDLLAAAGVAYPADDWTWDDWAAAARKLTEVQPNGRVARQGLGMETGKWGMLLTQSGGAYVDDVSNPSRCALTDPGATSDRFLCWPKTPRCGPPISNRSAATPRRSSRVR